MDAVLNKNHYLFTSESVGEGHPDKLCDQISDAVLDYCLELDPNAHVACESFATTDFVLVGGEISFKKQDIDFEALKPKIEEIARNVAKEIGYDDKDKGLDYKTFTFMNRLHAQSEDISQGVDGTGLKEYEGQQGAGDQVMKLLTLCLLRFIIHTKFYEGLLSLERADRFHGCVPMQSLR